MKQVKVYEATDKMIDLIRDNYNTLQSLSSFGIRLGFGDKTVEQVCRSHGVDTTTFLAVVNLTINKQIADHLFISPNTVITYRKNIARKLQIHSPAGLTIYAIANGLVNIDTTRKELI